MRLVDAEKEIYAGDCSITKGNDGEAVFIYEGNGITVRFIKFKVSIILL